MHCSCSTMCTAISKQHFKIEKKFQFEFPLREFDNSTSGTTRLSTAEAQAVAVAAEVFFTLFIIYTYTVQLSRSISYRFVAVTERSCAPTNTIRRFTNAERILFFIILIFVDFYVRVFCCAVCRNTERVPNNKINKKRMKKWRQRRMADI